MEISEKSPRERESLPNAFRFWHEGDELEKKFVQSEGRDYN